MESLCQILNSINNYIFITNCFLEPNQSDVKGVRLPQITNVSHLNLHLWIQVTKTSQSFIILNFYCDS